jgi:hypothetical protein
MFFLHFKDDVPPASADAGKPLMSFCLLDEPDDFQFFAGLFQEAIAKVSHIAGAT